MLENTRAQLTITMNEFDKEQEQEIRLRNKAIKYTIEFFNGRNCTPEIMAQHMEKLYRFLKTGSSELEILTKNNK